MPTAVAAPPQTIPAKLDALEASVNAIVLERAKETRTAVTALIARCHHLQVGPPGIAKTMLVDELVHAIDWELDEEAYYRWLMTRFTVPEELYGPMSLKGLENDEYRRNTARKLPRAKVAFLDEGFNANSAILNANLTLFNERVFFNNGDPIHVPLATVFIGTNLLPREIELAAMWDRITFRHEVRPLRQNASFVAMLRAKALRAKRQTRPEPVVAWSEIEQAQQTAELVEVPDLVMEQLTELKNALRQEGIEPTDRRWNDCIPVIQACAYRSGRSVATVDDMRLLRHILWIELDHQPMVESLVLALANPLEKEAIDLLNTVRKLAGDVDQMNQQYPDKQARRRPAIAVHKKLEAAGNELEELKAKVVKAGYTSDACAECEGLINTLASNLLQELYGVESP